ncbi:conserved hypothetical protein [Ricinus communis]|uniref:Uncharacterized protein n=1 Tax=Ricinus communis TaxID=3988 RepID=B9T811_RICCO|nr:conserved hypothetical protein [Ricinus communis]
MRGNYFDWDRREVLVHEEDRLRLRRPEVETEREKMVLVVGPLNGGRESRGHDTDTGI